MCLLRIIFKNYNVGYKIMKNSKVLLKEITLKKFDGNKINYQNFFYTIWFHKELRLAAYNTKIS